MCYHPVNSDLLSSIKLKYNLPLKIRRKELGYTQKYLSDFTGFSTSFISELENGKPTIELEKAL
ncbi:MAG: helix-turn-helix transcriptional regulator, partial [Alphaproteobacteria bacterium]|nr:helix-turn-helix transcriptional regulator [Alphaproteobacteria bacterium]